MRGEKKYMKLAAEFPVGTKLDIDALVETEPYQIQRFLHRYFLLARHYSPPKFYAPKILVFLCARENQNPRFSLPFFKFPKEGEREISNKPFIQIGLCKPIQ
jgi:hypothetical protein